MNQQKKSLSIIWAAINKNGKLSLHTEEPHRDEQLGIWKSDSPYVNSLAYESLSKMLEKTEMTWESAPEPFQIN